MNRSVHPLMPSIPGPKARTHPVPVLTRWAAALTRQHWRAAAFVLAATAAMPLHASQLVPQNLKQMIDAAEVIVTGRVSKITDGIENGLPFTEVTIKVNGSIKRDLAADSNYTFRQYGLLKARKLQDGRYLLPTKIEGMPTWTVGEKVTTFMNVPASRTRMTTPVGMAQGKFTYSGSRAANSFDNKNLFKGMTVDAGKLNAKESAMLAKPAGAIEGEVLMNFVKRAVTEQWTEKGVMR